MALTKQRAATYIKNVLGTHHRGSPLSLAMDKDKRGKHAKASRINWHATDSNYKRLNKAAKKYTSRKKKDKTLTIESFCLNDGIAKGIHHSVMQRYFDNDCRREISGQGRPYNCDTLLNKTSVGITLAYIHV